MKFKQISALFLIFSLLSVVLRTLQILLCENMKTGFFRTSKQYRSLAIYVAVIIIALIVATVIVASKVRRCPMKMPKIRFPLMVSSLVCGGFTAVSAIFGFIISEKSFISVLTVAAGVLAAGLFVFYGFSDLLHLSIKGGFFAIPIVYGILRLVNIFIVITSIASMWKNFIWALCECAQILFLLEFGRIASNINGEDYKKFLIIAFCAIVVGATYSLPNAFLYLPYRLDKGYPSGTMIAATLYCLGITVFEAAFTFSFYSNKNLKRHSNKKKHVRRSSSGDETNRFYIGDVEYHSEHHHHHHHHHSETEVSETGETKTDGNASVQ